MIESLTSILNLPSVVGLKVDALPSIPAIYFVVSPDDKLLYVGKSRNLHERFIGHHRKKQIVEADARVFYLQMPRDTDLNEIERAVNNPRLKSRAFSSPEPVLRSTDPDLQAGLQQPLKAK